MNISTREHWRLALPVQAKDVLKHANFGDPDMYADDSANFVKIFGIRPNSTRTLIIGGRIEF